MAFPQTPLEVIIELFYDGVWNDISQYVYHRDAAPITITRGRPNESGVCDPGELSLELNNRDGRFTPDNPNSPLFGKIGRNTQIRVRVVFDSISYTRITAEVTGWPNRWDLAGIDIWIPIKAAGILKRLGQGKKPLRSCMFRAMAGVAAGDYVPWAYWPLEDGADSAFAASGLANGLAMTAAGAVTFTDDAGLSGSDLLPAVAAGANLAAKVPAYTSNGKWVFQFLHKLSSAPTNVNIAEIYISGGTHSKYVVRADNAFGGSLWVDAYLNDGSLDSLSVGVEALTWGFWRMITVTANTSGSDIVVGINHANGLGTITEVGNGDYIGYTLGTVSGVKLLGAAGTWFGHAAVFTDANFDVTNDALLNAAAMYGYDGEEALTRFARNCTQAGIPYSTIGDTSAQMGPEIVGTLLEVLRSCADADQGLLSERHMDLGLQMRSNASRYNQVPIGLDYTGGHISAPFEPEPDDFEVFNDREVVRTGGSSARAELTEGPLSTQDPPDGVGRYDDSTEIGLYSDDQVPHVAYWRLHVGTWNAARYPQVHVDFSAASNTSLIPQLMAADSGDLVTVDNLPSWLPPETAELLVEGYEETIAFFDWDLNFNCSPAGPYNVVGMWGLLSQVLHSAMDTTQTTADIATTAGPLLATSGIGSAGYGTTIGGETSQITAVAASTVTFGATGAVSTGSSGSRTPGLPTGSASGNLILIFASTRNSGTGTVDTPASWTRLNIFPAASNCAVFARIYDGVWSMPTVTFTGGAANEDTIAQSIRLAGKWHSASNVLLSAASCLNASAQNITYPGLSKPDADNCIVIYFGWKQDDYTSVATIAGATEIEEASSIAGNDASQIWDYVIQTSAAAVPSGAFSVTGGASAISRGAVAFLRCDYQTATVTRSTNGVVASHSASDAVTATRPMRWGL